MQAEYRRDTHHSYLVLYENDGKTRESFQTRMFLENAVPGFLPCRVYDIDCSGRFFYDISSRQSLVSLLETKPLDGKMMESLLRSLLRGLNGLQDFLLDTSGFCLKAEWIYRNPSGDSFEFCYFPDGDFNWKEQLRSLAEYLLPHLEHKNREAVRLGYSFYQSVVEDKITAADLELLLQEGEDPEKSESGSEKPEKEFSPAVSDRESGEREAEPVIPASRDELLQAFFDSEESKKEKPKMSTFQVIRPWLEVLGLLLGGSIATFLFWYFCFDLAALVCGIATAGAVIFVLVRRWKTGKEEERDALMEQYVQVQDWLEEEKQEEAYMQEKETGQEKQEEGFSRDEEATCLLTSEEAYKRLASGYLVPDAALGGPTIAIDNELTMLGKSKQMDVILDHVGISRIHAKIVRRDGNCYLSDMNSRNGTRLNGILLKPEEEQILSDGDRIFFANAGYEWHCYRL